MCKQQYIYTHNNGTHTHTHSIELNKSKGKNEKKKKIIFCWIEIEFESMVQVQWVCECVTFIFKSIHRIIILELYVSIFIFVYDKFHSSIYQSLSKGTQHLSTVSWIFLLFCHIFTTAEINSSIQWEIY